MPTLPAASEFTGSTVTEAQFKTAQTNLLGFLSGLLGSDGAAATALSTLGALGGKIAAKAGAYTVLAADRGTVFHCSGTWTLTLTAAATLGTGFSFSVINTSSGTITIDPNAAELIDGVATKALTTGQSCIVTCNGTGFYAISGGGGDSDTVDGIHAATTATANKLLALNASAVMPCSITGNAAGLSSVLAVAGGGTGATTAAAAADNLSVVKRDHGHNLIGSLCFAIYTGRTSISPGGTVAGSGLFPANIYNTDYINDVATISYLPGSSIARNATSLSGTWRCIGSAMVVTISPDTPVYPTTLWQRIS